MINLNSIFGGMEAVSFQTNSQLGKDLTAVFQEVIDYRDNLDYDGIQDDFLKRRLYRIRKVVDFCNKTMGPKFIKVLEKDLGFKVKNFCLYGSNDGLTPPTGLFAVNADINAMGPDMCRAIMNMIGVNYENTKPNGRHADDVEELADCIDLHNTRLKKTTIGKNIPITIQVIYFDIMFAFCLNDFVGPEYAEELTAEEIAAIMMHECGHAMTIIEHSADLYVTCSRIRNDAVNIKKSGNIKDAKAFVKALDTKVLTKLVSIANASELNGIEDVKGIRESILKVATMTGKLSELLNVADKDRGEGSIAIAALTLPINIVFSIMHVLALVAIDIIILALQVITLVELEKYSYVDAHGDGGKASDRRNNKNNLFLLERWADEFVSRHGYGDYLASALNKFRKACHALAHASAEYTLMYHDPWLNAVSLYSTVVNLYISFCSTIDICTYLDPVNYENSYNRFRRILQNSKGIFKEENLPTNCVYEWLAKCRDIEENMNKAKRAMDTDFGKAAINTLHNLFILEPVNLYQLIKDGKLDRDCSILENRLDDMRNNALFMLSHQFRIA